MKVLKYRKAEKEGALRAHFSCQIETKYGDETIHGCSLFMHNGKRWVNLPDRKVEKDGEIQFFPYITFNREGSEQFRVDAINAIERFCAEAQIEFQQQECKPDLQYKDSNDPIARKEAINQLHDQLSSDFSHKSNTIAQNAKDIHSVRFTQSSQPIQQEMPF